MLLIDIRYHRKRKKELVSIESDIATYIFEGNFVLYSKDFILCSSEDIYKGNDGEILKKGINHKTDFYSRLKSLIGKNFDIKSITKDDYMLVFPEFSLLCFKEKNDKTIEFDSLDMEKVSPQHHYANKIVMNVVDSCYYSYYEKYGNVSISINNVLLCIFCFCKVYHEGKCIFSSYSLRKKPKEIKKINCLIGQRLLEIHKWNNVLFNFVFSNGISLYVYIDNRYSNFIELYLRDNFEVFAYISRDNEIKEEKLDSKYLCDF